MPYRAPVEDFRFIFDEIVDLKHVSGTERFADATEDMVAAILAEAGKMCEEVIAPVNRNGDLHPARLENGVVRSSPGFSEAYGAIREGGWVGMSSDPEFGGMGLPFALGTAVNDMMAASCLALQLNPLLSQGQIEALEHHASDDLKDKFLPNLISGEWSGTMNLTEPHAGSDVGALRARADPNEDGSYSITGQKVFITWGDSDLHSNTIHLVLARLPDGGAGTKGISLFLVPKLLLDENGSPGVGNSLKVVSLEHKMGIHGSPTAVMEFDGATGWLVGTEHGGMKAMFTMMNNARVGVAAQGVAIADAAYQHAYGYAMDRKQGATPVKDGTGAIAEHADVRRMLVTMKAEIFAARSMTLSCAVALDMQTATKSNEWTARAAFLTPIVKAYSTDIANENASLGVQIHGGMGFIEETGAAQFSRDARILPIYEGTNGIQAMDLVARKLMDGGDAAFRILEEIEAQAEAARETLPDLAEAVWTAAESLREATEWLLTRETLNDRFAGCVPYLRAFARVLGAHYHLKAAMAVDGEGQRTVLATFYIKRLLPEHAALLAHVQEGAAGLYDLSDEGLAV
ncbi:MAG: acyl-CoA dehydrogenase [Pseudoruegeria sp.]